MKKYHQYRQSSVAWLGEIPVHWKIVRLKNVISRFDTGIRDAGGALESGIPSIGGEHISKDGIIDTSNMKYISESLFKSLNRGILLENNLLLVKDGATIGKTALYKNIFDKAAVNEHVFRIVINEESTPEFIYYITRTDVFLKELWIYVKGSAQPGLDSNFFSEIKITLPDKIEQSKIIENINDFNNKISKFIEQKKKYIEYLKEYKQSIIYQIVTEGLNTEVKFTDSEIEWLPRIPNNWKTKKIRNIFYHVKEYAPVDNQYKLISLYTETGVDYRENLEQKGNKASTTDNYWVVKKGDIIINKLLAWMGSIGYSELEGVTSPAYDVIRTKDGMSFDPEYYGLVFRLPILKTEYKRFSKGILDMKLRLYFSDMGQIIFPVPPIEEQKAIVKEVNDIEQKYLKLISSAEKQIELIQQYRQSLIYELVTGKRKP